MKLQYILTHTYVICILYYVYSISTYVLCSMFYCGNDGLLLLSFWDVCAKAKVTQRNSQRRQPSAEQRPFYRRKPVVAKNACEGFAPPTIAPTDTFTNFSHLLNLAQLLCTTHCNTSICYTYIHASRYYCTLSLCLGTNLYSTTVPV